MRKAYFSQFIVEIENETSGDRWRRVEEIVRGTLVDLVNGQQGKFFQRHLFAYFVHPLNGEYYISGFRIAPSLPANPFPFGLGGNDRRH